MASTKRHRHLSRFCGWVNRITARWQQDGMKNVRPECLERSKTGGGWALWMQWDERIAADGRRVGARKPVNVPAKYVVDRLVMNLFNAAE